MKSNQEEEIMVSICCQTYNHVDYIKEALDSFLMQKTDFDFEILLRDDASTDGTEKIVREYANKYPTVIKPLFYKENQWQKGVKPFADNVKRAKGKYIALCEGDDYWIDPFKLQKQVDFMEKNIDFSMCFHAVNVIGDTSYKYPKPNKSILSINELFFTHYIPTCSVLLRKVAIPLPLPIWFYSCSMGDIPLELLVADNGLVKYIDEPMAVYRRNPKSLTQDLQHLLEGRKSYIFMYSSLRTYFKGKHYIPLTVLILKLRLGKIKDLLGLNPLLKKR